MRLDGKVTLITGVSEYMGPAFTRVFTQAGAIVCVQDKDAGAAEPHAKIASRNKGGGEVLIADLTDPRAVAAMFQRIDATFGRLDILVNNHSIVKSIPFDDIDDAAVDEMFAENFFSFSRVTREAVKRMKRQGGGKIVSITSLVGITGAATMLTPVVDALPPAYLSVYGASRGAQNSWTKAIGLELAPFNINVNAIAQENVDNNLMRAAAGNTEAGWAKLISRMPGLKIVKGEESAQLGVFLCSDLSESFYGQVIPLSGGVYR